MQLTKHTDYAFRVLIYLAGMDEDKTTIQSITELFGVSKTHLMKVVNELANQKWVKSTRGENGGIFLGCPTNKISVKDVIMKMEKTLAPVNCLTPLCRINSVCQLKPILVGAQNAFFDYLSNFTLADLIDNPTVNLIQTGQR